MPTIPQFTPPPVPAAAPLTLNHLLIDALKGMRIAMLTSTTASYGRLSSRPMALQEIDQQSDLWFFTDRSLSWVANLLHHPWVNLSFSTLAPDTYVSVAGCADLVQDPLRTRLFWRDEHLTWYPNGPDDPHLALLRVICVHAEAWIDGRHQVIRP